MIVNHQENDLAVGLYNRAGGAPNCLVAKHEVGGTAHFFWSTEFDPPRPFLPFLIDNRRHIRRFAPRATKRVGSIRPVGWVSMHRV